MFAVQPLSPRATDDVDVVCEVPSQAFYGLRIAVWPLERARARRLLRLTIHRTAYYDASMETELDALGRFAGPATLILSSLAEGTKHGYALKQDIERFAGVSLGPGTLYGALTRLEQAGLIAAAPGEGRRRPYELTPVGARALRRQLTAQRKVAAVGLRRLAAAGGT